MTATFFTVNGTGSRGPADPAQFPVMTAEAVINDDWELFNSKLDGRKLLEQYEWFGIDYPALVFPMGSSVETGVGELVYMIENTPGPFALAGYSQGAVVTSHVWRDYILNGSLRHRLKDFVGAVNWGNPCRCPGVARGNVWAGWPVPDGGGIALEDNLTVDQTPWNWLDFANENDLYTDCPQGEAGRDENAIYQIVMSEGGWSTFEELIELVELVAVELWKPVDMLVALAVAIYNGLRFAVAGPMAGHYTYDVGPAISWLGTLDTNARQ